VEHAVERQEANFIWKELNGIFRPVKSDSFKAAEEAAEKRGRKLPDPRAGQPTHLSSDPRVPRPRQQEVAGELGYTPYGGQTGGAKEPVFHNSDGDPPYISYDRDGHGSAGRGSELPPNIPWKGASRPTEFGARDRSGTYVPKYDADGNVTFDKVRR
jgi:hypothetical protein